MPVHVVGHGESYLRGTPPPGRLVAGHAHQPVLLPGQQGRVTGIWLAAHPERLAVGRQRTEAEKAQVDVIGGQRKVHLPHRVGVLRRGRPYQHRAAVSEQRERASGRDRRSDRPARPRQAARLAHPVLPGGPDGTRW